MSTALATQSSSALSTRSNAYGETEITMPQVGVAAEQQRTEAMIKAKISIAIANPRDENRALDRIRVAFQRRGLAENAIYSYSKGGTKIEGASIDAMTAIAIYWRNLDFGFRVLSQNADESQVECYAWCMESNVYRNITVTIPHTMKANNTLKKLTDPRDVYEHIANYAQRRVRKCLENVIPSDAVDVAVEEANKTLRANVEITPESIKKLIDAFAELKVTREMIEKRISRNIDAIEPAQMIDMRKIFKSIKDGMSSVDNWFKADSASEPQATANKQTPKEKLKAKQSKPAVSEELGDPMAETPEERAERERDEAAANGTLFDNGGDYYDSGN